MKIENVKLKIKVRFKGLDYAGGRDKAGSWVCAIEAW